MKDKKWNLTSVNVSLLLRLLYWKTFAFWKLYSMFSRQKWGLRNKKFLKSGKRKMLGKLIKIIIIVLVSLTEVFGFKITCIFEYVMPVFAQNVHMGEYLVFVHPLMIHTDLSLRRKTKRWTSIREYNKITLLWYYATLWHYDYDIMTDGNYEIM